ncbi:hypothetical protein [Myroides injenensis]|nr:hypothetical protein [Myroides injenensis]
MISEIIDLLSAFSTTEDMTFSTMLQQFFKIPSTNSPLYRAIMGNC